VLRRDKVITVSKGQKVDMVKFDTSETEESKNWIDNLADICRKHGVALCYLFGSIPEGYADAFSDVDIGVIFFDELTDANWWEYWRRLVEEIEPVVSPRELDLVFLQRAPVLLQWEAIHNGKLVYCANDTARADFEEKVIGEWLDFEPFLKRFQHDMVQGILEGAT